MCLASVVAINHLVFGRDAAVGICLLVGEENSLKDGSLGKGFNVLSFIINVIIICNCINKIKGSFSFICNILFC